MSRTENTTYEFDEYSLILPYREGLIEDIVNNFDLWLEEAKKKECNGENFSTPKHFSAVNIDEILAKQEHWRVLTAELVDKITYLEAVIEKINNEKVDKENFDLKEEELIGRMMYMFNKHLLEQHTYKN
jgi:hypothetical protein